MKIEDEVLQILEGIQPKNEGEQPEDLKSGIVILARSIGEMAEHLDKYCTTDKDIRESFATIEKAAKMLLVEFEKLDAPDADVAIFEKRVREVHLELDKIAKEAKIFISSGMTADNGSYTEIKATSNRLESITIFTWFVPENNTVTVKCICNIKGGDSEEFSKSIAYDEYDLKALVTTVDNLVGYYALLNAFYASQVD